MQNNFFKKILKNNRPYIIAEIGSNHNGKVQLAKKLIKKAKEVGADCVKFQSWTKNTIFSKKKYKQNFFLKDDYRRRKDYTLEKIVDKFSFSEKQLLEVYKYSKKLKIDFTSTPFSKKEVNFLVSKLNVPFIKVASMDLNNYPFLEYIAKKNKPMVVSTGLSLKNEIDKAVKTIVSTGNKKIILLHCVAIYPTPEEKINLNSIDALKKIYPYPIGFSDHSLGFSIPLAATAKGAVIIEKHFTLDKKMFGWDHKVSATPDELSIIVKETKKISKSLGKKQIVRPENKKIVREFRRSLVITRTMKIGEVIKKSDLDAKRPGTGLAPGNTKKIVGKILKRNLQKDHILNWSDFKF